MSKVHHEPMVDNYSSVEDAELGAEEKEVLKSEYISTTNLEKMNYYEILLVEKNADLDEITRSSHLLKITFRDDLNPDHAAAINAINKASAVLTDPIKKMKYDKSLAAMEKTGNDPNPRVEKINEVRGGSKKVARSTSDDSLGSTDSERSTRSNSSASSFESLLSSDSGQEISSALRRNKVAHVVAPTTEEPMVVTSVRDRANALNKAGGKPVIKR